MRVSTFCRPGAWPVSGALLAALLASACRYAPEGDRDADGLCDDQDLFPDDPDLPERVEPDTIFGITSDALYTFDPSTGGAEHVVDLDLGQIIEDVTIGPHGEVYVLSPDAVWLCRLSDGDCAVDAVLPEATYYDALATFPRGTVADAAALVAVSGDGEWVGLEPRAGGAIGGTIGPYADGWASGGDLVGTGGSYALVRIGVSGGLTLGHVDPTTRAVEPIVELAGSGLATWQGDPLVFDAGGRVSRVVPESGDRYTLAETRLPWIGAAVSPPRVVEAETQCVVD